MQPKSPHPLDYQPPPRQRRRFIARPFYRDYIVAYVLFAFGFIVGDLQPEMPGGSIIQLVAAISFFTGLLIIILAIAHSIWFVAGGKPRQKK